MTSRRTKIICTIGPASNNVDAMVALIHAGMSVARLNCSHGKAEDRAETIKMLREAAHKAGSPVGILLDLAGPKIRTGTLKDATPIKLVEGAPFELSIEPCEGTVERVSVNYKLLVSDVRPGAFIFLADGRLKLRVEDIASPIIRTTVVTGGMLGERKGINLVGGSISAPPFTEKDRADLLHGLDHGIDLVALSFVRKPGDITPVRDVLLHHRHAKNIPVIAKVERPEAITNIDGILDTFDVVMVARGDLGIEVGAAGVPVLQKMMIHKAIERSRPVVVATEMLETMIEQSRPTRAEVSDVANAVFDGADAVMLSGETAQGKHPVLTCKTMADIIEATEVAPRVTRHWPTPRSERDKFHRVGHAAAMLAEDKHVKAIVVFTRSGYSARLISAHRPAKPIFAFSDDPSVIHRCNPMWGVYPQLMQIPADTVSEQLITMMAEALKARGVVQRDDFIVVMARTPIALSGRTDTVKLHRVE